jgi:formate dehydrogenase subunit gamma
MDDRQTEHPDHGDDLDIVRLLLADAPSTAPDALLPLLHEAQRRVGHISPGAIRLIADACNLSRAEVHGVVTFYHDFQTAPGARHRVQLCMAEACQAVGCRELAAHARESLGVEWQEATPDGAVQIEQVFCFGNCATGPTIRIGDRIHGRVTPERFDALVTPLRLESSA